MALRVPHHVLSDVFVKFDVYREVDFADQVTSHLLHQGRLSCYRMDASRDLN